MFRERIVHWAKIFDLFACTMGTFVALARARIGPLMFARTYNANGGVQQMSINLQRDQAIAYVQISRLNR